MLEKPEILDEVIIACLQSEYGLQALEFQFLPLGADQNTAVYRLVGGSLGTYFVKMRSGRFEPVSVTLPEYLYSLGVRQVIAALPTQKGGLWADLGAYKLILYPFIAGKDGYEAPLSDSVWIRFGKALKSIHSADIPAEMLTRIRSETYLPEARLTIQKILQTVENSSFADPVAAESAGFLQAHHALIHDLLHRTEKLAQVLKVCSPELIVCHSDLHAGNLLVDASEALYIVDWDDPILAPRERDLMFVGGAQFGAERTPQQESDLFYQGYGPVRLDPAALAYYRYERILEDIAAYGEQLLFTNGGREDREQSLRYLKSNFLPNNTIEIAYQSDQTG